MPFLVLVGLGIVGVLGFQLWSSFQKQGQADAHFYIVQGKAKYLLYGQKNWDPAFSGTKFLLGDSLKTSQVGKAVVSIFNGTLLRLGDDTSLTLKDLNKSADSEKIAVNLDNGMIWLNTKKSDGVKDASYEVHTAHMVVRATGTVFEVESGANEVVRVFDSQVAVDVMVNNNGTTRVADTITVGVGQEITLDEATLNAFAQNQAPSVLQAVSDQFKTSDWYQWNKSEDLNPTQFGSETGSEQVNSSQEFSGTQATSQSLSQSTTQETQDLTNNSQEFAQELNAPIIQNPVGGKVTIDKDKYLLSGTVQAGVAKVLIQQVKDGKTDSYPLSKFKVGDTAWSYNLAESLGNLNSGENVYSVYALDSKGKKSPPAVIIITYNKSVVDIKDPLSAPVVKTFNGSAGTVGASGTAFVTATGVVKIEGDVKGAEKIVVNDFTLSKFVPGDTHWLYYANEQGGNLKSGLNEYQMYGIDPQGKKSEVVKFTITYNKPGATPVPAPVPAPAPAPSF